MARIVDRRKGVHRILGRKICAGLETLEMSWRGVGRLEGLVGGLHEGGRLGVGSCLWSGHELLHVGVGSLESVVLLLGSLQRIILIIIII